MGLHKGFFWYVFQTTARVKKGLVYLQYRGEIATLGRLKTRLGSQRE